MGKTVPAGCRLLATGFSIQEITTIVESSTEFIIFNTISIRTYVNMGILGLWGAWGIKKTKIFIRDVVGGLVL